MRNLHILSMTARGSTNSFFTLLEVSFFLLICWHLLSSSWQGGSGKECLIWTHWSSHFTCCWKSPRPWQKKLEFQSTAQPTSSLTLCEQAFSWLRHKVRTYKDAEWIYQRYLPEWCYWVGEVCDRWGSLDLLILWCWAAVPESAGSPARVAGDAWSHAVGQCATKAWGRCYQSKLHHHSSRW